MLEPNRIVRAWKDEAYRLSLSREELAELPVNPAGFVELSDAEMGAAAGKSLPATFVGCPTFVACSPLCPLTLVGCLTVVPRYCP